MNEKAIMTVRESPWRLVFWIKMVFTLFLFFFAWRTHYLRLTEKHLIHRSGFLSKKERTVSLDKIKDITVRQSVLGRIFGYGDISIETRGGKGPEFAFRAVNGAKKLRDTLMEQKR